jgi:glyoxylase-like metal-dependent hydrolase (beta-lactamase superfamily II)
MRWHAKLAGWDLTEVHDGRFRLDGGSMFGIVPKVLWQRLIPPDESNRIPLALRCLLARGHGKVVLIDTGMGSKWSPKEIKIYGIERQECDLLRELADVGVSPEEVTDVLITHLHFDHAGGNTTRNAEGQLRPTFPRATYRVSATNLEHAQRPQERDHVSYMEENWQPLEAAGQLQTFTPGEVLPGIFAQEWEGHTPGMTSYRFQGEKDALVYCADLIPTSAHVRVNYVMGYDLCARSSVREKRGFLEQAVDKSWTLFFEHDPQRAIGLVHRDERGAFRFQEPDPLRANG